MYAVAAGVHWAPGSIRVYRWLPADASYAPVDPWPSLGRFGDGTRNTLYVAETAQGAMAEFFRRHPELLQLQASEELRLAVFELGLDVLGRCLDGSGNCDGGQDQAVGDEVATHQLGGKPDWH